MHRAGQSLARNRALAKGQMGSRTKAREVALQALYQQDTAGDSGFEVLSGHFDPLDVETRKFAEELVRGVVNERENIDGIIEKTSTNWKIERMARVDRNILRLAVFELMRLADVPVRVTLNEAIELGKKFGSEESSSFVNGILDKIAHAKIPGAAPKLN
jgi:N utilization substance protein B